MDKLRLRFKKTGRAIYISHLDLMQTIQRSFSRAGYELKYSEGFNPHPQLSTALPMSVGVESVCEILDFRLKADADIIELPRRLSAAMPEGIEVMECYEPQRKIAELKYLKVEGRFEYDTLPAGQAEAELREFYSRPELVVAKRTKRGESQTDIMPFIRGVAFVAEDGAVAVEAVISAQEPTLNPELLADALRQLSPSLAPDFARFRRVETYDADMRVYR